VDQLVNKVETTKQEMQKFLSMKQITAQMAEMWNYIIRGFRLGFLIN